MILIRKREISFVVSNTNETFIIIEKSEEEMLSRSILSVVLLSSQIIRCINVYLTATFILACLFKRLLSHISLLFCELTEIPILTRVNIRQISL